MLADSEEARRRLESIIVDIRRETFGAKSEKLRPDQYHLPLEDMEVAQDELDAAQEKAAAIIKGKTDGASRSVEPQSRSIAGSFAKGGTDYRAEEHAVPVWLRRDGVDRRGRERAAGRDPAQLRVLVTRRPNTPAAAARHRLRRRMHLSMSFPAACRPRR